MVQLVALWVGSLALSALLVYTGARSLRELTERAEGEHLASREARFVAFVVDHLLAAAALAVPLTIALVFGVVGEGVATGAGMPLVAASGALPAGLLAFQWYLVAKTGQTIGKRWLGIVIVRTDGSPVGFRHGVGMRVWAAAAIFTVFPPAGIANPLFLFGNERRCLHDRLAGTKVIVPEGGSHVASPMRTVMWWLGVLVGLAFPVLTTITLQMPEPELGRFDLVLELLRITSLAFGVVLVLFSMLALLPMALDGLERGSFITFVSARLVRASKSGFLTVISILSILGVGVSSCALCSVTSIMGGFGHDLKRKILGNTAHVVVEPGPAGFEGWRPVLERVRGAVEPVDGAATPVVGGDAMASSATNTAGLLMRGVDAESIGDVIDLRENIELGRFEYLTHPDRLLELPADEIIGRGPDGAPYYRGPGYAFPDGGEGLPSTELEEEAYPGIILGRELAKSLHVMVGDELTVLSPIGELGPTGIMPKARKYRVAAIFYSGMYEYDASHAYVLLDVAQALFDKETRIDKIDIRIPEPEKVDRVRPKIVSAVETINAERAAREGFEPLGVKDWKEMNKNLFSALELEKIATFIILSIAIAVASFCIICTLLLMVTEKAKEIAVMKALGAADGAVRSVFMLEGILIGGIGTALGVSVALAACLGLSWTGVRLDPEVYYIDRLPVNVDALDYTMVAIASMVICTLATIYPAATAARVRPVDGLRYE